MGSSYAAPSILVRGSQTKDQVDYYGRVYYHHRVFPNPATTTLNIASKEVPRLFHLYDIFGREVRSGIVPDHGILTLDIRSIPRGLYYGIIDADNMKIIVGKLMVVGQ